MTNCNNSTISTGISNPALCGACGTQSITQFSIQDLSQITIIFSKNPIGGRLEGGEFEYWLQDNRPGEPGVRIGFNDASGFVKFSNLGITGPGIYDFFSIAEVSAPPGWVAERTEFPVNITVTELVGFQGNFTVDVTYPQGVPGFRNTLQSDTCGLVRFEDLTFDTPGIYNFTMRELTPSGGGWITDGREYPVVITVIDDGFGNLVASVEYPNGFPQFINRYTLVPVSVVVSACKFAVGAPLPPNRFSFGLFDAEGRLVATATNSAAEETFFGPPA